MINKVDVFHYLSYSLLFPFSPKSRILGLGVLGHLGYLGKKQKTVKYTAGE